MKSTDKATIKGYGNLSSIFFYFNGMISDCQIHPPVQQIIKGAFSFIPFKFIPYIKMKLLQF